MNVETTNIVVIPCWIVKYIVVYDWKALEPTISYLNSQCNLKSNPWGNFEWLAMETEKYLKLLETSGLSPESLEVVTQLLEYRSYRELPKV